MKVAIIGRTNVGKSTLFNVLTEQNKALVSKVPGTTRDRSYGTCFWRGKEFILIDTGGVEEVKSQKLKIKSKGIEEEIQRQIEIALKEADLILFLADIKDGILAEDKKIASLLRKIKKPVILVLNKADSSYLRERAAEFFKLGLGEPFIISALTGSGIGDLLDEIINQLRKNEKTEKQKDRKTEKQKDREKLPITDYQLPITKISIIGKTNVGKSSLLNAILEEERVIVSETPHTTREPQDTLINYKNQPILLVDTAGIRKKAKIKSFLEKEGVRKSLKVLKDSDVVLFMVEAHQSVTSQDRALANYIVKSKRGIIIVANKVDLLPLRESPDSGRFDDLRRKLFLNYTKLLHQSFPSFPWAPIIFISAKTGLNVCPVRNFGENERILSLKDILDKSEKISFATDISTGVKKVLDLALEVKKEWEKEIDQKELDKFFQEFSEPKKAKKTKIKIYSFKQIGIKPPRFTLSVSKKTELSSAYLKFLEKRLREKFSFVGTPVRVEYKIV